MPLLLSKNARKGCLQAITFYYINAQLLSHNSIFVIVQRKFITMFVDIVSRKIRESVKINETLKASSHLKEASNEKN